MLTGLAFPRGVFGGVGIVESIAAPALSPTPPPNGSILNGRRGGGAGRGRLTNQCVSSASLIEQAAGPRMTTNSVGRMNRIRGIAMIAGTRAAFSRSEEHTPDLQSPLRTSSADL